MKKEEVLMVMLVVVFGFILISLNQVLLHIYFQPPYSECLYRDGTIGEFELRTPFDLVQCWQTINGTISSFGGFFLLFVEVIIISIIAKIFKGVDENV
ncbi:MAG: hypothetical protein ACW990_00015 [Promethearchaeota archaeon]|jgi:hypothetical protein